MAKEDPYKVATARALKSMRENRGLKKSEVASRAGTTYLNVHRWESELATPTISNLGALADAYGTDLSEVASAIDKAKRAMREGSNDGDSH